MQSEISASRLAILRQQRGLSTRQLAKRSHLHASTLSRYENGILPISQAAVVTISRVLEVQPQDIDPRFTQTVLRDMDRVEKDLRSVEELQVTIAASQRKISRLQNAIAMRQKTIASYLSASTEERSQKS